MAYRWLGVLLLSVACVVGCGTEQTGDPFSSGGTGGGAGGTGGTGWVPACMTTPLCARCPAEKLCDTDNDCADGYLCIESGCSSNEGVPIKQCNLAPAGFCSTQDDCPEGRVCTDLGDEGMRCVKTTSGCDTSFDCVLGFSCENSGCVDRRVPCLLDEDCPKSHLCHAFDATRFCLRVHQSCEGEPDCVELAPRCEDIDGDGTKECAGAFNPNLPPVQACLNTMCSGAEPVCEVSGSGSQSACGQYGLCRDSNDCPTSFECVGLWLDGRKECVPTGGSCDHITDCPERQVCASPRLGGPRACQGGSP